MSELVDHLAELTRFRDRDRLDVTLVGALRELLQPLSVTVWGCVGEGDQQRWLRRAQLMEDDVAAQSDPLWIEADALPPLREHPKRVACLVSQQVQVDPGPPPTSLFPLCADDGVGGVLEMQSRDPMKPAERRLVCSILRIYQNFQSLLDYSERDTLTGLLNRKTFEESFLKVAVPPGPDPLGPESGRRAAPAPQKAYLGVIDVDHFKSVNDRFGHLIGDEVLLLLSRLMRSTFRASDRLYRFGGEEFVVMVRCDDQLDALHAFERMRENTERFPFPQVGGITVSIGFTEVLPADSPSAAFDRADRAVYYAKEHGRNQVHNHASLLASGAVADDSKSGDIELF